MKRLLLLGLTTVTVASVGMGIAVAPAHAGAKLSGHHADACLAEPNMNNMIALAYTQMDPAVVREGQAAEAGEAAKLAEKNAKYEQYHKTKSNADWNAYVTASDAYWQYSEDTQPERVRYSDAKHAASNRGMDAYFVAHTAWAAQLSTACGGTLLFPRRVGWVDNATLKNSRGQRFSVYDPDSTFGITNLTTNRPLPAGRYTLTLIRSAVPAQWSCSKFNVNVCTWEKREKKKTTTVKFTWNGAGVSKVKTKTRLK